MNKSEHFPSQGESLMDIAIHQYGSVSGLFRLLEDNPELTGPDHELTANMSIRIDENLLENNQQAQFEMLDVVNSSLRPVVRKQVEIKHGQSISDIALEYYGDISFIFQLLEDNPQIQSPESDLTAGTSLWIDQSLASSKTNNQFDQVALVARSVKQKFKDTIVYEGQSVLDLALQEYGDIESALDLLQTTKAENIGDFVPPQPGSRFSIRKSSIYNAEVADYYQNRNIKVNTGRRTIIEGIGLCSSDGILLISLDNFILKASDQ